MLKWITYVHLQSMQHNFFLIVLRKILDRNDQLLWSVGIGSALHLGVQVERPNSYCLLVSGPDIEVKCVTNSWLGRWQTKTTFLLTREWWEVRPVTTSSRTSQLSLSVQGTVHSTQYTVHSTATHPALTFLGLSTGSWDWTVDWADTRTFHWI